MKFSIIILLCILLQLHTQCKITIDRLVFQVKDCSLFLCKNLNGLGHLGHWVQRNSEGTCTKGHIG